MAFSLPASSSLEEGPEAIVVQMWLSLYIIKFIYYYIANELRICSFVELLDINISNHTTCGLRISHATAAANRFPVLPLSSDFGRTVL